MHKFTLTLAFILISSNLYAQAVGCVSGSNTATVSTQQTAFTGTACVNQADNPGGVNVWVGGVKAGSLTIITNVTNPDANGFYQITGLYSHAAFPKGNYNITMSVTNLDITGQIQESGQSNPPFVLSAADNPPVPRIPTNVRLK